MNSSYFNYANLIKPYGTDQIDDPHIDKVRMTEIVMKLYHPNEYETTRNVAAGIKEDDDYGNEEKQIHNTVRRFYLSKYNNNNNNNNNLFIVFVIDLLKSTPIEETKNETIKRN